MPPRDVVVATAEMPSTLGRAFKLVLLKLLLVDIGDAITGEKLVIGAELFTELVTERKLSSGGVSLVANGPTGSIPCAESDDESLSPDVYSLSDARCARCSARLLRVWEAVGSILFVFSGSSLWFTGDWENIGSVLETA